MVTLSKMGLSAQPLERKRAFEKIFKLGGVSILAPQSLICKMGMKLTSTKVEL